MLIRAPEDGTPMGSPTLSTSPEISVVIPVFNEEEGLPELLSQLQPVLDGLGSVELLLVNDGSRDRSIDILREAAERDPRTRVIDFTRNFGQHAAVFAGFAASRGNIVVTLDADLQNPPEEIPRLVAKIREGFDVVGSVRRKRQDDAFRHISSRLVNWFVRRVTGSKMTDYGCMLRAYSRPVVDAVCASSEILTFVPLLAEIFAGRVTEIIVEHRERFVGESKYSTWKLVRLLLDLTTAFTLAPLRLAMVAGLALSFVALLSSAVLIAGRVIEGSHWAVSGVFTVLAVLFVMVGALLATVGLVGEYVGRIYLQVRGRPRFRIREVIGNGPPEVRG